MCPKDQCQREFRVLFAKIDRLDDAVRGNGKPGIQTRLDRLELAAATRTRLLWLIAGSVVALAVGALWKLFFGA
ncbi:MAG: hypothetical protein FWE88_09795 [Phycisphaerae bacterium]|jgi:hypothetical protein|nr:hypothetical protein [Phycisphaerae bacterium]